ncbi:MAG: ABC transporter ATP-binding protein [Clostridium sp.]
MSSKYVIKFKNVSKIFPLKDEKKKNKFNKDKEFYGLKDINLEIKKGEIVGIVGTNGSGKSTLANMLAGISIPTTGEVEIEGEQALIAINTGLNNKLTGAENIELKGILLGFSRKKIKEITEGVIEFSELGAFINQPVKSYSTGMKSRLGFSISINLNPDILIIDEALSVGDKNFASKCYKKMNEFKEEGKTIFFISHTLMEVKNFCTKGLWIDNGEIVEYGDVDKVVNNYFRHTQEMKKKSEEELTKLRQERFENRIIYKNKKKEKWDR